MQADKKEELNETMKRYPKLAKVLKILLYIILLGYVGFTIYKVCASNSTPAVTFTVILVFIVLKP